MRLSELSIDEQREIANKILNKVYGQTAKVREEIKTKYGISDWQFYRWREQLLESKELVFDANSFIKARSTLVDAEGNVKMQWVKEDTKATDMLEQLAMVVENMADKVAVKESTPIPVNTSDEMMVVYTIGDAHIGMMAWGRETGADHDLEIAERDLVKAMSMMVMQTLHTDECFIVDVGDWFHSDNFEGRTAKSGNVLDVDGRYPKVLEIGMRLTTELIDIALTKHKVVRWRSAIGNHNEHSAIMMSAFIKAYYRNEPRVIVHDTPNMFMYHKFGKNLIGITHGHTVKADRLGEIMAVDAKDMWSDTEYRYWYTGHIHHLSIKEYPSCVVETFRTLASKDAWHAASGYRSGQDMKAITLHKEYGEIARNTVSIGRVRGEKR